MSQPLKFYTYDIETLLNFFSFTGKFEGDNRVYSFEISSRKNQRSELLSHLSYLQNSGVHMVGFNNIGFDYNIIHDLLNNIYVFGYEKAYLLCKQIIGSQKFGGGGNLNQVRPQERIIPQIDLYKINHFDNRNKSTSLKALQFAMRSYSVEDMPVELDKPITEEQMDQVLKYNLHDVLETEVFLQKCKHLIEMRKDLLDTGVLRGDVLNFSDVKIGTEYLISKIGRNKCFVNGNTPIQTFRESIVFKDIILPKITYKTETFQKTLDWFNEQIIYPKSDKPQPKLETKLANLDFAFGVGGVHASVEMKKYESNVTHIIKDVDVTGMYVSVAIANGFAPEHLGQEFKDSYKQLKSDRARYKKGTSMNATLKLAGNGVFGNSDNAYSCFYDPKYPKQVTVNGQLQLLQLAESLSLIPGLEIIQANTDGITVYMPRSVDTYFKFWKKDWETATGLELEEVDYSKMWIADVNNYLCVTTDGKIKAKGKYWFPKEERDYDGCWNKDFSMMVVPKVAEQVLINGWNPEALVRLMTDPFDFMIRYKTTAGSKVYIGDKEMSKTVRYYVSTAGEPMKKISDAKGSPNDYKRANSLTDAYFNKIMKEIPPNTWDERIHTKNKSKYEQREFSIESGRKVKCCNVASDFNWNDVDFDYYVKEINKLEII